MKNKCFLLGILSVLVIISFLVVGINAAEANKENYGKCISNSTKLKSLCYKEIRYELKDCKGDSKESYKLNISSLRESYNKCKKEFRTNRTKLRECNNNLRGSLKLNIGSFKNNNKLCEEKYNLNIENCKKDFKLNKEACLWLLSHGCEDYHYSDCPEECVKNCIPSICSGEEPNIVCTDDCDGRGSCTSPDTPSDITSNKCELLFKDIEKEYEKVRKCESDSECILGTISDLPCSIEQCFSVYNKNSDLKVLKEISGNYNKDCKKICPMALSSMCLDPSFSEAKCVDNKCEIKPKKINYCASSYENPQEINNCINLYQPVCGFFDPTKIQCFKYPCAQTFSNSCYACTNTNVLYWTEGECPKN